MLFEASHVPSHEAGTLKALPQIKAARSITIPLNNI
jgi:hypothetical protein